MIEVRDVTKRFGATVALDGVSFRLDKGEILGFLGPNGAGKSTAMKIVTTFLAPDSGTVSVDGIDVLRDPLEVRGRIGYLPENHPLYVDMMVHEYLQFVGRARGLAGDALRRRLEWVVEACGLGSVFRKPINELSKGFRQRVGLADALVHDPALLILDEPTNGLDPNQIRQIRELIRRLGNTHTILLSTHILHEVEMTCSDVIIIDGGRIKAIDTPAKLVADMRSAGRVTVELAADPAVAAGAITRLDHVRKVSGEATEDGWAHLAVLVESGWDIRESLAQLAAQYGWPLRSLFRHDATLEDVFVELTRRD